MWLKVLGTSWNYFYAVIVRFLTAHKGITCILDLTFGFLDVSSRLLAKWQSGVMINHVVIVLITVSSCLRGPWGPLCSEEPRLDQQAKLNQVQITLHLIVSLLIMRYVIVKRGENILRFESYV